MKHAERPRRLRPRHLRLLVPVIVGAVVFVLLWNGDLIKGGDPYEGPNMVFIDRPGGFITDDTVLADAVAGDHVLDDDLVLAAACNNSNDWEDNHALDLTLVVSTDPGLVRAAELYAEAVEAGDRKRAARIADYEQLVWQAGNDLGAIDEWIDSLPPPRAEPIGEYFEARAEPPSEAATERFVVYVINYTTTMQEVVYLDVARLTPELLGRAPSQATATVMVAGEDDPEDVRLSGCDELADRWDRDDPDLSPLPPIGERTRRDDD